MTDILYCGIINESEMNFENDEFLHRIAKTLYYGHSSSFETISLPLTELAAELYNEVKKENSLERLHVEKVAEINQNACISTCSLILAILYLEKIKAVNPEYVEKVAPSELFLISLIIASKFLNDDGDDDAVLNSEWAVCSGLSLKYINEIERKFLAAIKWEIYIPKTKFLSRLHEMEKYLANQEGRKRGWYSYTELNILLNIYHLKILKRVLIFSSICVTGYATSIIILISVGLLAIQIKQFILNCILCALFSNEICSISNYYINSNSNAISLKNVATFDESTLTHNDSLENIDSTNFNYDSFKNTCDTSRFFCNFTNSTKTYISDIFAINVRFLLLYKDTSQKHEINEKLKIVRKNSLLQNKYQWPNL